MQDTFLLFWESWPVFVTALVTLGVTVYAFLPIQKSDRAGMIYQVVTVMSFILALPAVLINPLLGLEWFQIGDPNVQIAILWLNLLGGLVALLSFLLSILGVGQINLPLAAQPFANAGLGSQHQIPTPPSSHSIRQSTEPSVRFTPSTTHTTGHVTSHREQNLTDEETSQTQSNLVDEETSQTESKLTDHAALTSIAYKHPVATLDEQASPSAAPTPVQPVTDISQNDKSDQTILLGVGSQATKSSLFAWLVALNGPHRGAPYALTEHRHIIGRASKCKIVLTDQTVSAQHAALLRDYEQDLFMLHDLKSSNGTYLHGQLITSAQPLKDKDRIRVGETDFHFMQVRLDELLSEEKPPTAVGAEETAVFT